MQKKSLLKKSLAILVAAAMTAGLAGCGGSGDSGSSETPSSGSAESTEGSQAAEGGEESSAEGGEAAGDLFGEETDIRVMVWDRGNAAPGTTTEDNTLTQWIKDQVKEKFNINVTYVSVPRSGSDDQLNIMMTGGAGS